MNCSAFRTQLEESSSDCYLNDETRTHAAACHACGCFYREQLALNKLLQSLEPVSAPPDFDHKLSTRISATRSARPTRRFFYLDFIPGTPSIIFASFFVLAVCTAVLLKETQSGSNVSLVAQPPPQKAAIIAAASDTETSVPTPPDKDVPAGNRVAFANYRVAAVTTKSTINASSKKFVDGKHNADFADLRREERVSEKELKPFEVIAPQTKSVVFSAGAAPVVMRPAATISTGATVPPAALIETAQAKAPFADLFLASGLETKMLTTQLAARYGATRGGLLVVSVQPQSAAFRAGLRPDDVIEALNNQFVSGTNTGLTQNLESTNDLSLTIVRGNQKLSITLTPTPSAH